MSMTLRAFIEARIADRRAEAQLLRETTIAPSVMSPARLGHEQPFMVGAFIAMWGHVVERADREARVLNDLLADYDRHHHD
jgi:hypothetical protein